MESITQKRRLAMLPKDIDIRKIKTGDIMDNVKTKYVRIFHGTEPLLVQTNASNIIDIKQQNTCLEVYIILTEKDNKIFIDRINELEEYFMKQAIDNKDIWFRGLQDVRFRSLWKNDRTSNDKIIKIKIPNEMKMSLLYLDNCSSNPLSGDVKHVSVSAINKDLPIRFILHFDLLYFYSNVFGINIIPMNVQQLIECEYVYQESTLNSTSLTMLNAELTEQPPNNIQEPENKNEDKNQSSEAKSISEKVKEKDEDYTSTSNYTDETNPTENTKTNGVDELENELENGSEDSSISLGYLQNQE